MGERRRRRRLQIRSVRRIVRRVELWSVLKLSLILYLCLWAVLLVAALILWSAVDSTGLIDRIEAFVTQIFGLESFEFVPGQIFRVYALGSLVMAFIATVFNVMAAVLCDVSVSVLFRDEAADDVLCVGVQRDQGCCHEIRRAKRMAVESMCRDGSASGGDS